MSSDFHHIPITPASSSLASHLQALDLLAARLSSLSTRAEWETRVPLNAKASIGGKIVNTSTVKINIGGEWWVDMTAQEAEAWVRRRKEALLEEHAKVLEGWRPGQQTTTFKDESVTASSETPARFDPVFRSPAALPVSTPAPVEKTKVPEEELNRKQDMSGVATSANASKAERPEVPPASAASAVSGPSQPRPTAAPPQTIQDVLATFMEKQEALAQATGKTSMPNGNAGDAMVNEEGLPIHEIREDETGKLIGDLPLSTATDEPEGGASITEAVEGKKEDFWSDDAAARRAALRRKVFDDSPDFSSDEDDDEIEDKRQAALPPTPPEPSSSPRHSTTVAPSINAIPPTPSSPHPLSPPPPVRRPSSSAIPGKSILKPSAPRKKSVSFDSSVPEPPDSPAPGPSNTRIGGSMFPTPIINIESGIEEKKVPVLNAPKPSPKRSTFGDPFAGFKPGFLSGGTKSSEKLSPPTPATFSDEPESTSEHVVSKQQATTESSTGKKPSLFAQRQRTTETPDDTSLSPNAAASKSAPSFPALSTSKGTSSVKNAVLEKPPPTRPKGTAGVAQTVTERPVPAPTAGPSRERMNGYASGSAITAPEGQYGEEDDDDDDDEDDDDFYADDVDDEEEEEYDLDDAMLAREVALAYHQNRAYTELGRPRSTHSSHADEEGMMMEEEDDGEGGVMMALPEISVLGENGSGPQIINPTPDSLRRFVRVGKLDNGKLVLAPGESGWSDEEEGQDGQDEKRENREEMKRALLGQGGVKERKVQQQQQQQLAGAEESWGLPPTIGQSGSTPVATPKATPAVGGVKEKSGPDVQVIPPQKKVSRFKADRMGNS